MSEYHLLGADWCGPCTQVKESEAYQQAPVEYHDVDTDEGKNLANQVGVTSIPTLVVMEGDEVITMKTGAEPVISRLEADFHE